jgi:N-acetylglutamate synthase-like GNAT family acetyltransferase
MPACQQESAVDTASGVLPVLIRSFRPGDEVAFKRLNEEWIVRYFVLEDKDREVLGDPVKYILNPGGQILFAVVGDQIVGCCALAPEAPREYEVAKMAVTEACRGRGIGRMLLDAVIEEARRMGASRLYLETNSKLPAASRLYQSVGFCHLQPERVKPSLYARADVFMEMFL